MNWKSAFEPRKEIILATVNNNATPHAIYVLSMGVVKDKVVIGACVMVTTINNIQKNNRVVVIGKNEDGYYRITGKATIYSSGNYLQTAISHSRPPMPTKAITVDIEEVFEMGNGKKLL